ncbi:hypothetical protein FHE66_12185 [Georgenia sp. 311]|uniref:hypothetical protein n=1 Tax=Georgenia sp. 311 TaxID=2585134 RepID=UPI0011122D06|nr:hypothetical protein [Georgenia sp. 311]TNC17126.1 hypothetical protein FHE66_12185 [Georgenia sp. 311]
MYEGTTTSAGATPLTDVRQSGVVGLVVRVAVGIGLVLGWVQLASMPVFASVEDLVADLERGAVTRVTLERPTVDAGASGLFEVVWDRSGRPGRASYLYESTSVGSGPVIVVDEADRIRAAAELSPSSVEIVEVDALRSESGTTWRLHGIAWLGTLLVLVVGPRPRLATTWAWFWFMYLLPPVAVAFLVLEPVPLWRRDAAARTPLLTGGWALLLALACAEGFAATPFGKLFA